MNKTFELHRLSMVIRWDILTNWKRHLGALAGLTISISIYCVLKLFSMRFWLFSDDVEQAAKQYQQSICMFYAVIAFIAFYILASCIFNNMKTKLQRESFLMLPAYNIEKFVARFLVMSIGGLVQLLAALILADVIQLIFSFIITPGFHTSITWPVLSHISSIPVPLSGNDWLKITSVYAFLLFAHSFATLGGAFYRKKPVLLTACTGILLCMILGYIINELGKLELSISLAMLTSAMVRWQTIVLRLPSLSFSWFWQPSTTGHPTRFSPACKLSATSGLTSKHFYAIRTFTNSIKI